MIKVILNLFKNEKRLCIAFFLFIDSTFSLDRTCPQIYEDTCARLNICPCSMIIRSINTTEINLRSYGLGPRGCAALAAALVVRLFSIYSIFPNVNIHTFSVIQLF